MYLYIKIDLPFCERVDKFAKANSVQFENISNSYEDIIKDFKNDDDFFIFRLSLYNYYKTKVKVWFVKDSEYINWETIEKQGFSLFSDVIKVDDNIFCQCLPYYLRKKYFSYNPYTRKYFSKINLPCQLSYND